MTDETRGGDGLPRDERPLARRLEERAAHLRARADSFARAAADDGLAHDAREAALRALVQALYDAADDVARIARDLETP